MQKKSLRQPNLFENLVESVKSQFEKNPQKTMVVHYCLHVNTESNILCYRTYYWTNNIMTAPVLCCKKKSLEKL